MGIFIPGKLVILGLQYCLLRDSYPPSHNMKGQLTSYDGLMAQKIAALGSHHWQMCVLSIVPVGRL